MLSKIIKDSIAEKFGREIIYVKDCSELAEHITQTCKTPISASTVQRLFGFVKGIREPRLYTLDIAARYLGMKNWKHLLSTLDKTADDTIRVIEKIKSSQIKTGETIHIGYEPSKEVSIKRVGSTYVVVASSDKKLQVNDVVEFSLAELHYPLTFSQVIRVGKNIGRVQVATVSGLTLITKD